MQMKHFCRMLLVLSILFIGFSCNSLEMKIENSNYDFYFSDLNNNKITDFELDQTNFYWFSYGFSSNQTIQEGIEKELKKYPGAKGLKS